MAQTEILEIRFKHEKKNGCEVEVDQTVEQVAQRDCEFSIFGDAQNLTGHSHEQPAVSDPVLSRSWTRRSAEYLPASVILCF